MKITLNEVALAKLLNSHEGPVGQEARRRADNVETRARINASGQVVQIRSADGLYSQIFRKAEMVNGEAAYIVGTTATKTWHGQEFSYPAYLDQIGTARSGRFRWLSLALEDELLF